MIHSNREKFHVLEKYFRFGPPCLVFPKMLVVVREILKIHALAPPKLGGFEIFRNNFEVPNVDFF